MRSKLAKQLWRQVRDSAIGIVNPHDVNKKYKQAKNDHVRNRGKQYPKLRLTKRQERLAKSKILQSATK